MKTRKCVICKSRKAKGLEYSDYCVKCGLYLGKIDKEKVIENIDAMLKNCDCPKRFGYYIKWTDYLIKFDYWGVKKIIENIYHFGDVSFEQFASLVQLISYLTIEFDYNITSLALDLFVFGSQFFENARTPFEYWLKVGLKEKNRAAYDYLLGCKYSAEVYNSRRGRRQIEKLKAKLRHLPN